MRFWTTFSRWVGPGGPPLGGDVPPIGPPPASGQDNLLITDKSLNYRETGPTHRIAVAFAGPAGAFSIAADIYLYEEQTGLWFKTSASALTLTPDTITFFVTAMVLSTAKRIHGDLGEPGGEIQCVLVPQNPGGLPNGEYKFSIAPVISESSATASGGLARRMWIAVGIPSRSPTR